MKDYNKETIEILEKKLIGLSQKVKKLFSNKKEIKKEYMKVLNELENKKHKSPKKKKKDVKKLLKSVKKCQKMGENGGKNTLE